MKERSAEESFRSFVFTDFLRSGKVGLLFICNSSTSSIDGPSILNKTYHQS